MEEVEPGREVSDGGPVWVLVQLRGLWVPTHAVFVAKHEAQVHLEDAHVAEPPQQPTHVVDVEHCLQRVAQAPPVLPAREPHDQRPLVLPPLKVVIGQPVRLLAVRAVLLILHAPCGVRRPRLWRTGRWNAARQPACHYLHLLLACVHRAPFVGGECSDGSVTLGALWWQ